MANDFARARSLFDGTKVEVFKQGLLYLIFQAYLLQKYSIVAVLLQVESQVADFRKDLMKKLYMLPSTLADQKKTIK